MSPRKTEILLVTCCMEASRYEVLERVVENLRSCGDRFTTDITVFDNASRIGATQNLLRSTFPNVYRADRNVGYWTAIDWWLKYLSASPPEFTYIIESDVIHYDAPALWDCEAYLDEHPNVGSVRVHEYSIKNWHLYNKDRPTKGSRKNIWQSHTNKVTKEPIRVWDRDGRIWCSNFLTQLPALNRYGSMLSTFTELAKAGNFSELDFQVAYWRRHPLTGILDGGIFNNDLNVDSTLTGSWSSDEEMRKVGYRATRQSTIELPNEYSVKRLV